MLFKNLAVILTVSMLAACGGGDQTPPTEQTPDITPPVITLNGNETVQLNEKSEYVELGATAQDNVDGVVNISISGQVDNNTPGAYIITYSAQDSAGNQSEKTRTVNVLDVTPPVLTLIGSQNIILNGGEPYFESGAFASDNYDSDVTVNISGIVDSNTLGLYEIIYTATDSSGNQAQSTRFVEIVDTMPPQIDLNGPELVTLPIGTPYIEPGFNVYDHFDQNPMTNISGEVNENLIGVYVINYTVVDQSGNSASASRTIKYIDTTPPLIILTGGQSDVVNLGTAYADPGAAVSDNSGETLSIEVVNNVDVHSIGEGTISYSAEDSSGNRTTVIRTISVVDNEAPVITLNGPDVVRLEAGSIYVEQGVSTTDNSGEPVTVTVTNNILEKSLGAFNVFYTATDSSGNTSNTTRQVIFEDTTPPVISVDGPETIVSYPGLDVAIPTASVTDNFDDSIELQVSNNIDINAPGQYEIKYVAVDSSNLNTQHVINVTVSAQRPFIAKIKTNIDDSSADATMSFYFNMGEQGIAIDWGDGHSETTTNSRPYHQYEASGTYTVKIYGDLQHIDSDQMFGSRKKWVTIEQWGDINWTSMRNSFLQVGELQVNATDAPDLSNVEDVFAMFYQTSLTGNLSHWDVSKVKNFEAMLSATGNFNGDLSNWDMSSATSTRIMFAITNHFNSAISQWNVSNVTDMSLMFNSTKVFNSDLSNWNTSSVTNMRGMFGGAEKFNSDLSKWDVSSVTNMNGMFRGAYVFTSDLSNWDVSNVTDMSYSFSMAHNFSSDLSKWNIEKVNTFYEFMTGVSLSTSDYTTMLESWSEQSVKTSRFLSMGVNQYFESAQAAKDVLLSLGWTIIDGGSIPVRTAEQMVAPEITLNGPDKIYLGVGNSYTELSAIASDNLDSDLTLNVSGNVDFNTAGSYEITYSVTDSDGNTTSITRTVAVTTQRPFITTWDTTLGADANDTTININTDASSAEFYIDWGDESSELVNGTSTQHTYSTPGIYTVKIYGDFARITNSYSEPSSLKLISVDQWGDLQWSSMNVAFGGCENLQINASDAPDLSQVTSLSSMFQSASSVNTDLSHWDVSTITEMSGMFNNAQKFNGNISTWDVSNVTNMDSMFEQAYDFNQAIGNWDVSQVQSMARMFVSSHAFNQDLNGWNTSSVTTTDHMFSGATSFNGDISSWDVGLVTNMRHMFNNAIAFGGILDNWNVENVTKMTGMFQHNIQFATDLSAWDISNVQSFVDFLAYANVSSTDYTEILKSWSLLSVQPNIVLDMGDSQYYESAQAAKDVLLSLGWTINDGGSIADPAAPEPGTGDTNAPVITLIGSSDIYTYVGNSYTDSGATVTDNIDNDLTIDVSDNIDTTTAGIYEVTYSATDSDGNTSTAIRTVNVTAQRPFVTSWKTDNVGVSNDDQISINTGLSTNNYYVDWGDGTSEIIDVQVASHTYETVGTYQVTIFGDFEAIYNNPTTTDALKLESIDQWGDIAWTTMNSAFYGADNIDFLATDAPDLSLVTDMSDMFRGITKQNVNFNSWNVSSVLNMSGMFRDTQYWHARIDQWQVTSVTNMSDMFNNAEDFYAELYSWLTTSVTNMSSMFSDIDVLHINPGLLDVSNVTDMTQILANTTLFDGMYSVTLYTWSQQNVNNNITLDANLADYHVFFSSYRDTLVSKGWTINDGGSKGAFSDSYMFAPEISLYGDYVVFLSQGDSYMEEGADATDDNSDDVDVVISGTVNSNVTGHYQVNYSATDPAGNTQTVIRHVFVE